MLKDCFANLDELNNLARRMESFFNLEMDPFLIGISKLDDPPEKDLIDRGLEQITERACVSIVGFSSMWIHFINIHKFFSQTLLFLTKTTKKVDIWRRLQYNGIT